MPGRGCIIGLWAGAGRDRRCGQGRSGRPRPSPGDDGGSCCGGSDGPRAVDGRGRRVFGALVPQRTTAPRQPRAASCCARGALCALRLHPRPVVRGLLVCGHQPMEVRGDPMLRGGNTERTPLGPGTPACGHADTASLPCVARSELRGGLGDRGHDPSMLTRLSSETRSQQAGGPAASPWKNGDWAFRGVAVGGEKSVLQEKEPLTEPWSPHQGLP